MKNSTILAAISGLALVTAACSGEKEAPDSDAVTETRMDDMDVIDGTISDDMVDVDTQASGDELAEGEEAEGSADGTETSAGDREGAADDAE